MRRRISAICAILAIVLFSNCLTAQTVPTTYGSGGNTQTDPDHIQYHGMVDGQFIDADMVPIRMCDGQLVWAQTPNRLYRIIVEANQHVAKGEIIEVVMETRTHWYLISDYFEIQSISIKKVPVFVKDTVTQKITPVPVVSPVKPVVKKKSIRKNPCGGGTSSGQVQLESFITQSHYPSNPCGDNVTINGSVNIWVNSNEKKE